MELYENIKSLRQEKGMSQEELAKKVGYTGKSMVARIEAGQVDLGHSKIVAFAQALGVKPAVLMGWTKEEPAMILDVKTEKHLSTYLSLNAERRAKVDSYTEEQLLVQQLEEKKSVSSAAMGA